MGHIYAVAYYSAIKSNEILILATTWTVSKSMKPNIKGHILYDSIYMKYPEKANPQKQSRLVVPKGRDGGNDE